MNRHEYWQQTLNMRFRNTWFVVTGIILLTLLDLAMWVTPLGSVLTNKGTIAFGHIVAFGFIYYHVWVGLQRDWSNAWRLFRGKVIYVDHRDGDVVEWVSKTFDNTQFYVMQVMGDSCRVFVFRDPKNVAMVKLMMRHYD